MQSYFANLGIEVTRRCNQVCENFCMRGASQAMDIPVEYIDLFLDQKRNQYKAVDQLLFSGGEPTLNEDAIVYTVQKIISEKLPIYHLSMVTNGLVYSDAIVQAFEKYNEFFNSFLLPQFAKENVKSNLEEFIDKNINTGTDILFSNDQYHHPISQDVLSMYYENGHHIRFHQTGDCDDSDILHSGFSDHGRNLTLEDNNVRVFNGLVMDLIYLTAKGNLSCYGDGSYDFLDQLSNQYSISSYTLPDFYMSHLSSSSVVDGKVLRKSKSWKKKK